MVPREHISDKEICNMIRLKVPEAVKKGLETNLVHLSSFDFTPTAEPALSTVETFRLSFSEARQAGRDQQKRLASDHQQPQQTKRKRFEKQAYSGNKNPPQASQAATRRRRRRVHQS